MSDLFVSRLNSISTNLMYWEWNWQKLPPNTCLKTIIHYRALFVTVRSPLYMYMYSILSYYSVLQLYSTGAQKQLPCHLSHTLSLSLLFHYRLARHLMEQTNTSTQTLDPTRIPISTLSWQRWVSPSRLGRAISSSPALTSYRKRTFLQLASSCSWLQKHKNELTAFFSPCMLIICFF